MNKNFENWFEGWKEEIINEAKELNETNDYEEFYRTWFDNYKEYSAQNREQTVEYREFINALKKRANVI